MATTRAALVLVAAVALAACGSSGRSGAAAPLMNTPFCQTLIQLGAIQHPSSASKQAATLLTQGEALAPADLSANFRIAAEYARAQLPDASTKPPVVDPSAVQVAFQAVNNYAQANCGVTTFGVGSQTK